MLFKTSDIDNQKELAWSDLYSRETYPEYERLLIGCESKEIPRVLELCKDMEGPFGVLYVLLVSRLGKKPGRYQTPSPLSFEELKLFLYEHQEFFEQDARHHLWISSMSGEGQFIYDQHNYIYAYGNIDSYISKLKTSGFKAGEISIPAPHCHNYHLTFDSEEEAVLNSFKWLYSPLAESDEA